MVFFFFSDGRSKNGELLTRDRVLVELVLKRRRCRLLLTECLESMSSASLRSLGKGEVEEVLGDDEGEPDGSSELPRGTVRLSLPPRLLCMSSLDLVFRRYYGE
eukprot:TRINITY_DN3540_c0_g2_i1.p3 TRINITY_DN3540_c0_g2~~TRINITY_DN3540_c0_g2_i1.p3  ORF type:complete len:104 (+),score=16.35 TRINITY_DN3540_c0_g2_i1:395-706(+)